MHVQIPDRPDHAGMDEVLLRCELFDGLLLDVAELLERTVFVRGMVGKVTRAVVAGDAPDRAVLVILDEDVERCVSFVECGLQDVYWDQGGELDTLTVVDGNGNRSVTFDLYT
jgi:hypothetical protein